MGNAVGGGLPGVTVTNTPATGQILVAQSASTAEWTDGGGGPPTGAAGGDLGSTYPNPHVTATHLASPLPLAQGGTGQDAGSAADLLGELGALAAADNLSDLADAATARGNLGLGTAAVQDTGAFEAAGTSVPLDGSAAMTGTLAPAVATLTFGSTIAVDATAGNSQAVTLTDSTGTLGAPSGAADGMVIRFRVIQDGTGGRTLAYATGTGGYDFGAAGAPTLSTGAGDLDILGFEYVDSLTAWRFLGSALA